jgi:hypothetical protein
MTAMAGFSFKAQIDAKGFQKGMTDWARRMSMSNVIALTKTAKIAEQAEYDEFRRKIDRPTPWTMRSLFVIPAKPNRPNAELRTKDDAGSVPAGAYLNPLIDGGARKGKSTERKIGRYMVPSRYMNLNAYGGADISFRKLQSQLRVDGTNNASSSAASKRKRKNEAFFIRGDIIYRRSMHTVDGKNFGAIIPQFILVDKAPEYRPIIYWVEVAQITFDQNYLREFNKAFNAPKPAKK